MSYNVYGDSSNENTKTFYSTDARHRYKNALLVFQGTIKHAL